MQFEFRFYFDVKEGRFNDSVPSEIAVRKAGKNIQWRDNSGKGTMASGGKAQDKAPLPINMCPGFLLSFNFIFSEKEKPNRSISLYSFLKYSITHFIEAWGTDKRYSFCSGK